MSWEASEHRYYERKPLIHRKAPVWPGGAKLAFAVVVSVEYYEMQPPEGAFIPPNLPGMFGRGPYPDFGTFSRRDYGNRVGLFRIIECLDRHGLKATAAIDAFTATERPFIVGECKRRGWEIAGHGKAVTQVMSSRMSEAEERAYIAASLDAVEVAAGTRPKGWHGPEYGESARTPALLAELGLNYVLDWPNDEQPYPMTTAEGGLVSVPIAVDFDDVYALWHRRLTPERWRQSLIEAVDTLMREEGRMLVLNLHPWLIGHPYRVTYLEEVLADLRRRDGIWFPTAGEIAAMCPAS